LTKKFILHKFKIYLMKDNILADLHAFHELSDSQQQVYRGAVELYQAYLEAGSQHRLLQGGMHWKKIRGREYLYRYRDRYGHGGSLGPRSQQTEQVWGDFSRQRQEVTALLKTQRLRLQEQARFCRAASINLVPTAAAKLLRRLEQHELGRNLLVIGTAAIYAYEFAAGVLLEGSGPQGLWAHARRGLTLIGEGQLSLEDLLRLLRQTDRSLAPLEGDGCRAANRDGFLVQVLKSGLRRPGKLRAVTAPGAREPLPPDAGNLQYLAASPKLSQVVIGQDGWPATMTVPDPRAFALHHLWRSQQQDREEFKRTRDWRQALAVADLVLRYLPQYDFSSSELDMFPRDLARDAEGDVEQSDENEMEYEQS